MGHSPDQMRQKAEAMRKAEHALHNDTVDGSPKRDHSGMMARDVYSDASGKPSAREYELPEGKGYVREELS